MQKANKFFFLAQVNDHIVADFRSFDGMTRITCKHKDDQAALDTLRLNVERVGKGFVVDYAIIHNGIITHTAKSDVIPCLEIYGVIAGLINEVIAE